MSKSGIIEADTGNVPCVPTDITATEEMAPTDTCTGNIDTGNINTNGNTSITRTPGVSRGGNLSPHVFDTLIKDIGIRRDMDLGGHRCVAAMVAHVSP